jgi:ATP-binding cassette subfamily F protein 3
MKKPVAVLSGGEKNRLALAHLLLKPSNFLILDEPTNHLDMASKEILQQALMAFPGTTFVVSHDRHFLNPVVNKILEIQPGSCRIFPGDLNDYLWKIDQENNRQSDQLSRQQANQSNAKTDNTSNPRERRRRQAIRQQAISPLKKKLADLEREITRLEESIQLREREMSEKAFFEQGAQTTEKMREYEHWKTTLSVKLSEWEQTGEKLDALENELA